MMMNEERGVALHRKRWALLLIRRGGRGRTRTQNPGITKLYVSLVFMLFLVAVPRGVPGSTRIVMSLMKSDGFGPVPAPIRGNISFLISIQAQTQPTNINTKIALQNRSQSPGPSAQSVRDRFSVHWPMSAQKRPLANAGSKPAR